MLKVLITVHDCDFVHTLEGVAEVLSNNLNLHFSHLKELQDVELLEKIIKPMLFPMYLLRQNYGAEVHLKDWMETNLQIKIEVDVENHLNDAKKQFGDAVVAFISPHKREQQIFVI